MSNIILLSGKIGSGKTSQTKELKRILENYGLTVHHLLYAKPLYDMHDKVLQVLASYGVVRNIPKDGVLLQHLGDWIRNTIDQEALIKLMHNKVDQLSKEAMEHPLIVISSVIFIVDDARTENEFNAFPDALKIRLECPEDVRVERCEDPSRDLYHFTETGLDKYASEGKFDMYLDTFKSPKKANTMLILKECIERWGLSKEVLVGL